MEAGCSRFLVVKAPCQSCERVSCKTLPHPDDSSRDRWMDVAAFRVDGPRLSDIRAQRVVRVLVLRRHRQHIVEAGNPLEVGDAQTRASGS